MFIWVTFLTIYMKIAVNFCYFYKNSGLFEPSWCIIEPFKSKTCWRFCLLHEDLFCILTEVTWTLAITSISSKKKSSFLYLSGNSSSAKQSIFLYSGKTGTKILLVQNGGWNPSSYIYMYLFCLDAVLSWISKWKSAVDFTKGKWTCRDCTRLVINKNTVEFVLPSSFQTDQ